MKKYHRQTDTGNIAKTDQTENEQQHTIFIMKNFLELFLIMIHSTNAACLVIFAIWFDIFSFSHMHKIPFVLNDMTICREMSVSEVILQFIYTY